MSKKIIYTEPSDYFPKETREEVFQIKKGPSKSSVMSTLGARIRTLRKEKTGLSQENFARAIKMDRTYFASVELGRRNIALVNLKKIADGLGVTLSELFKGI